MNSVKIKGPWVTVVVAALAMAGVVGAFANNASPYVTIGQARRTGGDSLHLAGVMDKDTFRRDFKDGQLSFDLKDSTGETINVEFMGAPPASLQEADKVVAVGAIHGDHFVARDLLVKCPSKYDAKNPQPLAASL